MPFDFVSLNSGSNGNATYVASGNTRLLVDAGLSARTMTGLLGDIRVLPETLTGILITHEHSDHVRGIGALARKYHIPVYANEGTWGRLHRSVGELTPGQRRVFETGHSFYVGDIGVNPIPIPHDAAEPVAYRLYAGSRSISIATDLGHVPKSLVRALSGSDVLLFEANHDEEMLIQNPRYPGYLKQRILGSRGHLSNIGSANALLQLLESGVGHVFLGHLSEDNNTPELAMTTVCNVLERQGLRIGADLVLEMTWRDHRTALYSLT